MTIAPDAAAALRAWMGMTRTTGRELAALARVSESTITFIRRGDRLPSREVAAIIERITYGAVPASMWGRGPAVASSAPRGDAS